ncbi:MAG: hypothetical protein RIQ52_238 [Pseudomonadota bacterium]
MNVNTQIAVELAVHQRQVDAAVALLDGGATVPFVARYRKEATGGLDDTQLRQLEVRLVYLRELEVRRAAILRSIEEQGKLGEELRRDILAADTKTRLEDLYLPYKPKRRTRAQIAREAGLEPLADSLLAHPELPPESQALAYINASAGVADTGQALDGARQILMERMAEDAALTGELRERLWSQGRLRSRVVSGKESAGAKFADYFDYEEALSRLPSHRTLAILRGRNEDMLQLTLLPAADEAQGHQAAEHALAARHGIAARGRPGDDWLLQTARLCWRVKLLPKLELDVLQRLRESAEQEAIRVFSSNLRDLLLAAPAGPRVTLGLDPGLRTGVKMAVIDATGQVLETGTIYPHAPQKQWAPSMEALAALVRRHGVTLISIGNGTASRETDELVAECMQRYPDLGVTRVTVSEAGASVYSASELAAREFPGLDVSLRGAVSIARRIQDPLAELVKIDPRAIGVGQYQHDVNPTGLAHSLDGVVEDCVNAVGVDVNTASASLLRYVSGLSATLADNIVQHRNQFGPFRRRASLLDVPRLGPRAYEQAAGFLRIRDGDEPLDASAVHPEAYPLVQRMLLETGKPIREVIGNTAWLRAVNAASYTDSQFGLPTVQDILSELEKPGRDPRPAFVQARFREGVTRLTDLKPGMQLEGVITNVTNFGAFVDIGVHQDGLVHLSQLADHYVASPRDVVKTGDVVHVRVLEIDEVRRRVSLTMRSDVRSEPVSAQKADRGRDRDSRRIRQQEQPGPQGSMAEAWARASKGR